MRLSELGEFALIDRVSRGAVCGDVGRVVRAIGDDAAVVLAPDGLLLVTTDLLVEGVHFLRDRISPRQLGRKLLTVNLSDIAAMGGVPRDAWFGLAAPAETPVEELDELFEGLKELATETRVNLLGGDTSLSPHGLVLSLTLVGSAPPEEVLLRSGARPGDHLVVTGSLGDSAAGLRLLLEDPGTVPGTAAEALRRAHLEPRAALAEGRVLATTGGVRAAIDISDGLASDLGHVCRASGVGAVLEVTSLPVSEDLVAACRVLGEDPHRLALTGGEDYRLLAAVAPEAVQRVSEAVAEATGRPLTRVGEVVAGIGVELRWPDGHREEIAGGGWDHFVASAGERA